MYDFGHHSSLMMEARASAAQDEPIFKLYHYNPTIAGAIIFVVLFVGTTGFHFYQLSRSRCWFMIPFALGGILELIGYAARARSGQESPDWTLVPYIIQALLILVAPALFAATIYMELGRIVTLIDGEDLTLIRKAWMTKLFVCGDILSFMVQSSGGGLQATGGASMMTTGANITVAGLFIQLLFFGLFIVVAVAFYVKVCQYPTASSHKVAWKKHMVALFIASLLIMVRSVFRVAEYLQGFDGYLLSHEAYLYGFDALLMWLTMVLLNWIHPAEILALRLRHIRKQADYVMDDVPSGHHRLRSDLA
ncbi:Putative RTA-like protein [Colletotrichum destructivum]|uniref:RTA-like protein n=1 Tax=Colletotrichum destructivum TaxID=34406 RepID=A0AAX4J3S1_9PEZI|nr:Putative RTA-like protein [Colletotrichum destructivum]